MTVDPDLSEFRSRLRERLQGANAGLGVKLEVSEREIARLRRELARIRPPMTVPARVEADRDRLATLARDVSHVGDSSGGAGRKVLSLLGTLGKLSTAASSIPAVAGLSSAIASMSPAAGVAAPAVLALASAGVALKVGMSGVSDALSGDAEAMEKLAPAARDFVSQTKALGPAWDKVKRSVQGNLFRGLGDTLTRTANSVLPVLRTELSATASALNAMGKDALGTARTLAQDGSLGQALQGATRGLQNMRGLPGTVLQGLVQLGAAAAPTWERMTASMGQGLDRLRAKMNSAFESGAMQRGIEAAVGVARQFGGVLANVGRALGNVLGAAAQAGGGALQVLSELAATAAKVTATPEAQETFRALFETVSAVGRAVSTILGGALKAAMPLLNTLVTTLAGPMQSAAGTLAPVFVQLAQSLGAGLAPVVKVVAQALAAILPIAAELVSQLAGALGPVLETVGKLVGQIASALLTALKPILDQLPTILGPILSVIGELAPILGDLVGQLITALAPALATIGKALGELLVACAPLITALGTLLADALKALVPVITPVITLVGKVAGVLAELASKYITTIVVPAIKAIAALLRGDFSGALDAAKTALSGLGKFFGTIFSKIGSVVLSGVSAVVGYFADLASRAWDQVKTMGSNVADAARSAMSSMGDKISSGIGSAVGFLRSLPGRARDALGNLGSTLWDAGASLIRGFINGISSMISSLKNKLGSITNMLPDWKGPAELDARILTPNGRLLLKGFMQGIEDQVPALKRQLGGITADMPAMVGRPVLAQVEQTRPGPSRGRASAAINIDHFHAGDMQPAQVARELDWLMKARG
ncbi:phage tail protein [Streptomyces noursei]|uniref:phage tail protein n=1 Tax=Streptomyces noursei TaxID=1971 RepID=UPI0033DB09B5